MKAKLKSLKESRADPLDNSPLMLSDHRLKREYSVIEIATLAAGCRSDTPAERIEEAIQLLASARN